MIPTVSKSRQASTTITIDKNIMQEAKKLIQESAPTFRNFSHLVEVSLREHLDKPR